MARDEVGFPSPSGPGFVGRCAPSGEPEPFRCRLSGEDSGQVYRIASGRYAGALWGELYGWQDLARALADGAPRPQDLPTLVGAAAARWPEDFPGRLKGLFALVLWDQVERRLWLYRDPSAARGLYYHLAAGGELHFATRLDDLVRQPGVERRLARRSLHEYLRFLDISTPNTLYQDVYSVEPGQGLLFRDGRLGALPRARVAPPQVSADLDAAAAELESCLQAAVRARLDPGGRSAVFLSGGIDSALLCSLAAEADPGRVAAVTVGFEAPGYDESAAAARIAAFLGVTHHRLRFGEADYLAALEQLAQGSEQPFADPAGLPTLLAFQFCRGRFATVLDGTGADTLLGVMPARHARLAVGWSARLPYPLRRAAAGILGRVPRWRGYRPLLDFRDPEELLIRWNGFRREEIEVLCGEPVSLAHTRFYRVFSAFPRHAHYQRYSALLGNLPDDRLHQAALLTGLPVRFPFWDSAVERCLGALPLAFRYRAGESKVILRRVLARRLPETLWNTPKHGFDFPYHDLLKSRDRYLVRRYLGTASPLRELFAPGRLDPWVDRFLAGDDGPAFRIWGLVILSAWLEWHPGLV